MGRQEENGDFLCINQHKIETVHTEMPSERKISPYHVA